MTEITGAIRTGRGEASRGTTTKKLRALETMGVIMKAKKSSKAKTYDITQQTLNTKNK